MAIRGLTDNVTPRFQQIGKLHKGAEKPERGWGKELPYFRFASDRPEIVAAFAKAYGANPSSLTVYLPYPDVERNFATWKEHWVRGGLEHRCDGETMTIWLGPDARYHQDPRPCPYASGERPRTDKDPGCRAVGRLTVILPGLWQAGYVGYVTMETHSLNDLLAIQAALQATYDARGDGRGLQGILFTLRRAEEEISTPGENGQRARRKKWLVKIEPSADWVRLQLQAAHQAAMGELPAAPKALPAGQVIVDRRTGEVIDPTDAPDDVEEGEYTEESPTPPPAQAEPPKTAKGNGRPFTAAQIIKGKVNTTAQQLGDTAPAQDGLRGLTVGLLNQIVPAQTGEGQAQERHLLTWFLFGKAHSEDLTVAECKAILRWGGMADNAKAPNVYAQREAQVLLTAAQAAGGQATIDDVLAGTEPVAVGPDGTTVEEKMF